MQRRSGNTIQRSATTRTMRTISIGEIAIRVFQAARSGLIHLSERDYWHDRQSNNDRLHAAIFGQYPAVLFVDSSEIFGTSLFTDLHGDRFR